MSGSSKLEQFQNKEYIRLETFRRNGQAIPTPVWFVTEDDMLFVRSYANSGKVKRMRNNPHVRITPSDALGSHTGLHRWDSPSRGRGQGDKNQSAPLPQIRADEDVL